MGASNCINLFELPSGTTYEDRYGAWMQLFRSIAYTPTDVLVAVVDAPPSWAALLSYMQCHVVSTREHFEEDRIPQLLVGAMPERRAMAPLRRSDVEALCVWRPETIDGLYKFDNEWHDAPRRPLPSAEKHFPVTTTAAFFRPEVLEWLNVTLPRYTPTKRNVVLCPCAADKPYPAPLHRAILDLLPPTWYVANATGVLGLVPQDLWDVMPHYDSGIPNERRVEDEVNKYFMRHPHDRVVVYSDFYANAIHRGLAGVVPIDAEKYVFGADAMGYQDLLSGENLARLDAAIGGHATSYAGERV